ncbi:hypothetical protein E2C01_031179 [Portunus trituberculatus]|uniref:Uncharacterized protein n=1 Tax=Portunus trituberculatus TaxID=210409 RepID=A0A5B7ESC5_PORTR|nr:hypothetical protein [Portunus trituberculatus]
MTLRETDSWPELSDSFLREREGEKSEERGWEEKDKERGGRNETSRKSGKGLIVELRRRTEGSYGGEAVIPLIA